MTRGSKDGFSLSVFDDQLLLLGIHRDFQRTVAYRFVFHIEPVRQIAFGISLCVLDAHGIIGNRLYCQLSVAKDFLCHHDDGTKA